MDINKNEGYKIARNILETLYPTYEYTSPLCFLPNTRIRVKMRILGIITTEVPEELGMASHYTVGKA
jgi:hypothetical protein